MQSNKIGLGVINVTDGRAGLGAEVPIPVVKEAIPPAAEEEQVDPNATLRRPTISVTKPPVYPVDLPTPSQISPRTPVLSFDHDLERGTSYMDNIDHPLRNDTSASQSLHDTRANTLYVKEAALVSLPSVHDISNAQNSIPVSKVDDLLQNDAQDMRLIPNEPVLSPDEPQFSADPLSANNISTSPVSESAITEREMDQSISDSTVRLVNGNGIAGIANGKKSKMASFDRENGLANGFLNSSSTSIHSPTSPLSPTLQKSVSKHEKRRSLSSGLKMFRQGSKQKNVRDSVAF